MEDHKNIANEIEKLGYDFSNLKENTKSMLQGVYTYKEQVMVEMIESASKIKQQYFTITRVAERIGCSRTTIYENDVLKHYIDVVSSEAALKNPYREIEKLGVEIIKLQDTIEMMKVRDTELLLLKRENRELKEQINTNKNNIIQLNKN